jgi:hypothetical protein
MSEKSNTAICEDCMKITGSATFSRIRPLLENEFSHFWQPTRDAAAAKKAKNYDRKGRRQSRAKSAKACQGMFIFGREGL